MVSLYKRKYITMFAKLSLFAFSFAWILCNFHYSLPLNVSDTHTTPSHSSHEEDSTHNSSCLDHTYQISGRNQENSALGDVDLASIATIWFSFNLTPNGNLLNQPLLYIAQKNNKQDLFLENSVLRL